MRLAQCVFMVAMLLMVGVWQAPPAAHGAEDDDGATELALRLSPELVLSPDNVPTLVVFGLADQLRSARETNFAVDDKPDRVGSFVISPTDYEALDKNPDNVREHLRKEAEKAGAAVVEQIWNLPLLEQCLSYDVTGGASLTVEGSVARLGVLHSAALRDKLKLAVTGVWGVVDRAGLAARINEGATRRATATNTREGALEAERIRDAQRIRDELVEEPREEVTGDDLREAQMWVRVTHVYEDGSPVPVVGPVPRSVVHTDESYQLVGLHGLLGDRDQARIGLGVVVNGVLVPTPEPLAVVMLTRNQTAWCALAELVEARVLTPSHGLTSPVIEAMINALLGRKTVGVDFRTGAARGQELGVFPFVGVTAHRTHFVPKTPLTRRCKWIVTLFRDKKCRTRYYAEVGVQPDPPLLAPGRVLRVPLVEVRRGEPLKDVGLLLAYGLEGKDTILIGGSFDINSSVSVFAGHAWWDPEPGFRSGDEWVFGFSFNVGKGIKGVLGAAKGQGSQEESEGEGAE